MAIVRYCWRCGMKVPMLTESEWKKVYPLLLEDHQFIIDKRKELNLTLDEVLSTVRVPSCRKYFEITGFESRNPNAIWHHRNSAWGEDCQECGKPLRTPRAKMCAACGASKAPPRSGSRLLHWLIRVRS